MTGSSIPVGDFIRRQRKRKRVSLGELSGRTGITISTLSRIETGKVSATFDRIQLIAAALNLNVADFFAPEREPTTADRSRRAISRAGGRTMVRTPHYVYEPLGWEFADQAMFPAVARLLHRDIASFGPLIRHFGQEFIYVLKGRARIVTEQYEETILEQGDALYIDSTMGHAFLDASDDGETLVIGGATERHPRDEGKI
jgi:transcriptional regulator with XRE-family HTH domain